MRVRALAAALCFAFSSGCGTAGPAEPIPSGNWIYADAAKLTAILIALEHLEGTPAARYAAALRERISGCQQVIARSAAGNPSTLLGSAGCAAGSDIPGGIASLRAEGDVGFAFELAPGRRATGRLTQTEDGAIEIVADLDTPEANSLAALLVPGAEPVGDVSLSSANALLHARLRPASGLNIAELVSPDSQADRMFRLRSELFLGRILSGTWELAIYMPADEHVTPPMALAIDYPLRSAAQAAVDRFVAELEATWPIHHSEQGIAGREGACFHGLRLLPDLVPCWVLTEQSIVVGWNPSSVAIALGAGAATSDGSREPFGPSGGMVLHLDRLPEADRRLQRRLGAAFENRRVGYLWDTLRLEGVDGEGDGGRLRVRVSLELAGAS